MLTYISPEDSVLLGDRSATVCFTGPRPKNIPFDIIRNDFNRRTLASYIYLSISEAYQKGKRVFLCGMAQGIDMLVADTLRRFKQYNKDAKFVAVLPYIYPSGHSDKHYSTAEFHYQLEQADEIIALGEHYETGCFYRRNRFMVDNSSLLIAVHSAVTGGTANTMNYAKRKGVPIEHINLIALKNDLGLPDNPWTVDDDGNHYLRFD